MKLMKISKLAGRLFFLVSYPLYFRRKLEKTNTTRMFDFDLTIPPTVFHPAFFFSTRIFGDYLRGLSLSGKQVLDMGSGSGLLSLIAAQQGAKILSVDINPRAVDCTRMNAEKNNLAHAITAIQSDLFENVVADSQFDYVIWNPPFFPVEPKDEAANAWKAGKDYRTLSRFAEQAGLFLSPDGRIIVILSTQMSVEEIAHFFTRLGFRVSVVHKHRSFFEKFIIYEFRGAENRSANESAPRPTHASEQ